MLSCLYTLRSMHAIKIELRLSTVADAHVIDNLWPAYIHDLAVYTQAKPNAHGVLIEEDACREWRGPGGDWWNRPGILFPYLILAADRPAGFCLISSGSYLPSQDIDLCMHEFFVAYAYRGTGCAARAVQAAIAEHVGRWEVVTYPAAKVPIQFWRKVLPGCATGPVTECEADHPWGRKVTWRFRNDREPGARSVSLHATS